MHAIRKGQIRWVAKGDPCSAASIYPHHFRSLCVGLTLGARARLRVYNPIFATEAH
jgi:hypothetical protein